MAAVSKLGDVYQEILTEYLLTYDKLNETLKRLDRRIEELVEGEHFQEPVHKLKCFIGIEKHTALSLVAEISDFSRFPSAEKFASFLGFVPGEHTSSDSQHRLGITKAGNSHLRRLLTESAHCFGRGKVGYKSAKLKKRQEVNSPEVICYADKANERLRRKFYKMTFAGKKQCRFNGCCQGVGLFYLGDDDKPHQCCFISPCHTVPHLSRVLRTADAALPLTDGFRCGHVCGKCGDAAKS